MMQFTAVCTLRGEVLRLPVAVWVTVSVHFDVVALLLLLFHMARNS